MLKHAVHLIGSNFQNKILSSTVHLFPSVSVTGLSRSSLSLEEKAKRKATRRRRNRRTRNRRVKNYF